MTTYRDLENRLAEAEAGLTAAVAAGDAEGIGFFEAEIELSELLLDRAEHDVPGFIVPA